MLPPLRLSWRGRPHWSPTLRSYAPVLPFTWFIWSYGNTTTVYDGSPHRRYFRAWTSSVQYQFN